MEQVVLAAGLIAAAQEGAALSCNSGNTASAWSEAQSIDAPAIVVRGRFYLRDAWRLFEEEDYELSARFEGVTLAPDGTTSPLRTDVMVIGACINGDCGYLTPRTEVLTFLHAVDDGYVTYSMPCSSFPLAVSADVEADLHSCMNDGPCVPEFLY